MTLESILLESSAWEIAVLGWLFFGAIYIFFAGLNFLLTKVIFPAFDFGGAMDAHPPAPGQLRHELLLSASAIFVFGLGLLAPWALLQSGWAHLASDASGLRIAIEVLCLFIWNEIHFYFIHRLMHTRWLIRFHRPHHRSVIPTPWTSYSFHPFEALVLGTVLPPPMLLHDFSATALLLLPILGLIVNNIGHSNFNFLPWADRDRWWLNSSRRHYLHHACIRGNYGFMFPFMDRLCGTALPPDAADKRRGLAEDVNTAK